MISHSLSPCLCMCASTTVLLSTKSVVPAIITLNLLRLTNSDESCFESEKRNKKAKAQLIECLSRYNKNSNTCTFVSLSASLDLKLQPLEPHLALKHDVDKLLYHTEVLMRIWTSQICQEFASFHSGIWPREFMIKTRLGLPNSERPEK